MTDKLNLPPGVSFMQAHKAVAFKEAMSPEQFGAYCRTHGLHADAVDEWAGWFKEHPDGVPLEEARSLRAENRAMRAEQQSAAKKIERLQKEMRRKDKSLAEYATLMAISKKARAIWENMDEESASAPRIAGKS